MRVTAEWPAQINRANVFKRLVYPNASQRIQACWKRTIRCFFHSADGIVIQYLRCVPVLKSGGSVILPPHPLPLHRQVDEPTVSTCILTASGAARGEGGKLPPYGWTSKNYVICVRFHCHGTSSYHTTNTLQGRRAKSHVDTQTIQQGLRDFVL